jgi:hypothetical protein
MWQLFEIKDVIFCYYAHSHRISHLKAAIKHEAKTQGHYMSLLHALLAYCELKHINIGG